MTTWVIVVGMTILAAVLRFSALGRIPPGLYHDEAFNGLDGLRVLQGQWSVYFTANRGREPLLIHLIAATVGLLGRTPGAVRLAAAVCGTLTIPATYLMTRAWFDRHVIPPSGREGQTPDRGIEGDRRIALVSAAVMTTLLWHVHLSRVGFRAVTFPLAAALALWFSARAFSSDSPRDWVLGGFVYGLCFYTYIPARFTPLVLVVFALYLVLTERSARLWPGGLYFAVGALVAVSPLTIYAAPRWEVVMGRPGQVSVFNPLINDGHLWGTLGRQLLGTLGMFFVRGDTIPRHNPPGRPVFSPVLGIAMVWGVIQAVIRARDRDAASALTLIWVGFMLVPTWLAEDAPHFLRAVGVLPLLVILPALGLDGAMNQLEQRGRRILAMALPCAVLAVSLSTTVWDYFIRYPTDPRVGYAFEEAAVKLASEANRFIGAGWDGAGIVAPQREAGCECKVYIDGRLWEEWAAIPFLVSEMEAVVRFQPGEPPTPAGPALLLFWPHEGVKRYVDALPHNVRIRAHAGPLTRGDLEEAPYPAYVAYTVQPRAERSADHVAHLDHEIALVDYTMEQIGQAWKVELTWEALVSPERDYTVFVYLYDDGRLAAQHDGEPGDGYYPTGLWRRGDIVVDTHLLRLPKEGVSEPRLAVGMYLWPSMERLEAETPSGASLGDEMTLPIASVPVR